MSEMRWHFTYYSDQVWWDDKVNWISYDEEKVAIVATLFARALNKLDIYG